MIKKISIIIFLLTSYQSYAISPTFSLKASGGVSDFVIENNILYAATDAGVVDIF